MPNQPHKLSSTLWAIIHHQRQPALHRRPQTPFINHLNHPRPEHHHPPSHLRMASTEAPKAPFLKSALERNTKWASTLDPTLMKSLATGQKPEILWIGCSDSRVPAEQILDLQPGSIFVHRNIANILHTADPSSLAVIDYAVNHLKVSQVMVCGHVGCGGIAGAMTPPGPGLSDSLNLWLNPAREVRMACNRDVKGFAEMEQDKKVRTVIDGNVRRSLSVLRMNPSVVKAMVERGMELHGLVYNVGTGKLEEIDKGTESEEEKKARELCFGMTTK